jgi:hypothetical protein
VLKEHGDVYCQAANVAGWPRVNVVGGDVRISSVTHGPGLGAAHPPLEGLAVVEV